MYALSELAGRCGFTFPSPGPKLTSSRTHAGQECVRWSFWGSSLLAGSCLLARWQLKPLQLQQSCSKLRVFRSARLAHSKVLYVKVCEIKRLCFAAALYAPLYAAALRFLFHPLLRPEHDTAGKTLTPTTKSSRHGAVYPQIFEPQAQRPARCAWNRACWFGRADTSCGVSGASSPRRRSSISIVLRFIFSCFLLFFPLFCSFVQCGLAYRQADEPGDENARGRRGKEEVLAGARRRAVRCGSPYHRIRRFGLYAGEEGDCGLGKEGATDSQDRSRAGGGRSSPRGAGRVCRRIRSCRGVWRPFRGTGGRRLGARQRPGKAWHRRKSRLSCATVCWRRRVGEGRGRQCEADDGEGTQIRGR